MKKAPRTAAVAITAIIGCIGAAQSASSPIGDAKHIAPSPIVIDLPQADDKKKDCW